MCKLDDILNTEIKTYESLPTAQRGIGTDRVRFNTDVMFSVAKSLEMPLDKTAELMRRKNMFKRLGKAYVRRNAVSMKVLSDEIIRALKEE